MTYKEIIKKYIDDASEEDMEALTDKTNKFVEEVRMYHPELVDKFLMKIDLVLNPHFTEETAKYVVSNMKNKDGSVGEHWKKEVTDKVLDSTGFDFRRCDWYYVLNMIYSDYYKEGRSDETYIELAGDFLSDVDAPEGKAKKYWKAMHY